MSDDSLPPKFVLETNPILANLLVSEEDTRELVTLFGYIGTLTAEKVRIYPKLSLGTYFEIKRDQIIHAERANPKHLASITKLIVLANAELTLVTRSIEKITASQLDLTLDKRHPLGSMAAPSQPCHCGDHSTIASVLGKKGLKGLSLLDFIRLFNKIDHDIIRCGPDQVLIEGKCVDSQ